MVATAMSERAVRARKYTDDVVIEAVPFEELAHQFAPWIERTAHYWDRIPSMSVDDLRQELLIRLDICRRSFAPRCRACPERIVASEGRYLCACGGTPHNVFLQFRGYFYRAAQNRMQKVWGTMSRKFGNERVYEPDRLVRGGTDWDSTDHRTPYDAESETVEWRDTVADTSELSPEFVALLRGASPLARRFVELRLRGRTVAEMAANKEMSKHDAARARRELAEAFGRG